MITDDDLSSIISSSAVSSINVDNGLTLLLTIVGPILGFVAVVLTAIYADRCVCRRRAFKEPPIGFNKRNVYDHKAHCVRSVKRPIYLDNHTGKRFLGKEVIK